MTFEEAKALLKTCELHELADHTFGDSELMWMRDGQIIASAYFGSGEPKVGSHDLITDPPEVVAKRWKFTGSQARELRYCYKTLKYERNDDG